VAVPFVRTPSTSKVRARPHPAQPRHVGWGGRAREADEREALSVCECVPHDRQPSLPSPPCRELN